jgi:hypothetical protein
MRKRLIIALAVLAVAAAACGGDDEAATTTGADGTTTAASGDLSCDSLLALDDVAALFGEPAVFDAESSDESTGPSSISCVWASVESADDLEDLQTQLFQIQVYRGEEYYNPEIAYEDYETLEGIGDDAFFSPQLGVSTGFKDEGWAVFVTFSVIGTGDAPDSITKKDQVIALLRLVHDRVV